MVVDGKCGCELYLNFIFLLNVLVYLHVLDNVLVYICIYVENNWM